MSLAPMLLPQVGCMCACITFWSIRYEVLIVLLTLCMCFCGGEGSIYHCPDLARRYLLGW